MTSRPHNSLLDLSSIFAGAWFFLVLAYYFSFHPHPRAYLFGAGLITIMSLVICGLYPRLKSKTVLAERSFSMSLFAIAIIFFGLAGFYATFLHFTLMDARPSSFFSSALFVFWKLGTHSIFIIFCILFFSALGKKIFSFFSTLDLSECEKWIFSLGLGFLAITYTAFFLGLMGYLSFWPSLAILGLASAWCFQDIGHYIHKIFTLRWRLTTPDNLLGRTIGLYLGGFLVLMFLVTTFVMTFRAWPLHYDDLDSYASVPEIIAHYHGAVPLENSVQAMASGIAMYWYAMVQTVFFPEYNYSFSWMSLLFLLAALYLLIRYVFSEKIARTTIFLALGVPWGYNFANTQKIDFIFAFFSILALYAFFLWLKKRQVFFLYLAGAFLGFTVCLKFNGLFLFLAVVLFLFGLALARQVNYKHITIVIAAGLVFFLPMALLQWRYYHNAFAPYRIFPRPQASSPKIFSTEKKITLYDVYYKTALGDERLSEMTDLIRNNRPFTSPVKNFFWIFWNETVVNTTDVVFDSGPGPWVIIFFPFFLIYFFSRRYYTNKTWRYLLIISILFLMIWQLKGFQRIWYGIAMYYVFLGFAAVVLHDIKNRRIAWTLFVLVGFFSVRMIFVVFELTYRSPNVFTTAPSEITRRYNDSIFGFYDIIHKEIMAKNKDVKILMMPESRLAGFWEWDKHVIADHFGVYWGKLIEEAKTSENVRHILREQGITHIIFSYDFYRWLKSYERADEHFSILRDLEYFAIFKKDYLAEVYCQGERFCIYQLR